MNTESLDAAVVITVAEILGSQKAADLAEGIPLYPQGDRMRLLDLDEESLRELCESNTLSDVIHYQEPNDVDPLLKTQLELGEAIPRLHLSLTRVASPALREGVLALLDAAVLAHRAIGASVSKSESSRQQAESRLDEYHHLLSMVRSMAEKLTPATNTDQEMKGIPHGSAS